MLLRVGPGVLACLVLAGCQTSFDVPVARLAFPRERVSTAQALVRSTATDGGAAKFPMQGAGSDSLTAPAPAAATIGSPNPTPASQTAATQDPVSNAAATVLAVPGPVLGTGLPALVVLAGATLLWRRGRRARA